ncbi:MAG: alpha/beta hydrolase [Cylindrospermopsis raciborskii]|jgi:enterochelin esterase-like enzyme|uniref:alpha/beta hydrolase n=1 Tax=Cylindrospermopsis raciborskii TaxID=77022 RepID=UPI003D0BF91D
MNQNFQENHKKTIGGRLEKIELYSTVFGCMRKLYLYLPPGYKNSCKQRYPVLYMHHGQHLFEPKKPDSQSWRVHETIEELLDANLIHEIIVVGIAASAATVASDYWHYAPLYKYQQLTGYLYESFIVQEVKPFIDENYRTLSDRSHTTMIGACSGATVSYNIAERHPHIFAKVGMLSPAVRSFDTNTWLYSCSMKKPQFEQLWLDVGDEEGVCTHLVREWVDRLIDQGWVPNDNFFYYLEPHGAHHQIYWSKRLKNALLLFFGDKGQPVSVKLRGEKILGTGSKPLTVNPVVEYDTGFQCTDFNGNYHIEQEQMITMKPRNRMIGLSPGVTKVSFSSHGLETSDSYTVVSTLPDQVQVHLRVHVPESTPQVDQIYFGTLELQHTQGNIYESKYNLPWDFTLADVFSCGMDNFERQSDGSHMPLRLLQAREDMDIEYRIERWSNCVRSSN